MESPNEEATFVAKDFELQAGQPPNVLHYGALVYLSYTEDNTLEYYAYSEGFNETSVYLKSKEMFETDGTHFRGLFRVYPSFYHNQYLKGKTKFSDYQQRMNLYNSNKRGILNRLQCLE